jgi:hypothetical protein
MHEHRSSSLCAFASSSQSPTTNVETIREARSSRCEKSSMTPSLVLIFLGWWTLGIANALYAAYKYFTADEVQIKVEED